MKEFFCKTAFLTVGAFFERPRANAVRPYERMWECESDSFCALFPEFRLWRIYLAFHDASRAGIGQKGGYANRILLRSQKEKYKNFLRYFSRPSRS